MPRSPSPPISPKTVKHHKRPRQPSNASLLSHTLSISELTNQDAGYDADIEVVRPDQYEEPESDFEDDSPVMKQPVRCIATIDEEITRGMRRLGWRQTNPTAAALTAANNQPVTVHASDIDLNRDLESSPINQYGKRPEFQIHHHHHHASGPPAKRRKKRESQQQTPQVNGLIAQRFSRPNNSKQPIPMTTTGLQQTDSSDRTEEGNRVRAGPVEESSSSSTATTGSTVASEEIGRNGNDAGGGGVGGDEMQLD